MFSAGFIFFLKDSSGKERRVKLKSEGKLKMTYERDLKNHISFVTDHMQGSEGHSLPSSITSYHQKSTIGLKYHWAFCLEIEQILFSKLIKSNFLAQTFFPSLSGLSERSL